MRGSNSSKRASTSFGSESEGTRTSLASDDPFNVYSVARLLARTKMHRDGGLAAPARVADLRVEAASFRADISRNMLLFGDPVEKEKRLAAIRERESRWAEGRLKTPRE